jgi:hypothetical protein
MCLQVCDLVLKGLAHLIRFPLGIEQQAKAARQWKALRPEALPNVVGAVDGSYIRIKKPGTGDLPDNFINRKGYHSITLQAVVDAQGLFIDVTCGDGSRSHDAFIFGNSDIGQRGPDFIINGYYLLGDPAYPLHMWLLKTYTGQHLTPVQLNFNRVHCSQRVVVEQAFGKLKARWRRLRDLDVSTDRASDYIVACCLLHNYAELRGDSLDDESDNDNDGDDAVVRVPRGTAAERAEYNRIKQFRDAIADDL